MKSILLSLLLGESTGLLANSSYHLQDVAYGPCIFHSVIQFPFLSGPRFQRFNILGVVDSEFQTILNSWREISAIATIASADWSYNQGNCTYTAAKWSLCSFNLRHLLISLTDPCRIHRTVSVCTQEATANLQWLMLTASFCILIQIYLQRNGRWSPLEGNTDGIYEQCSCWQVKRWCCENEGFLHLSRLPQ